MIQLLLKILILNNFDDAAVDEAGLACGDEAVAFLDVAGSGGDDFDLVVEALSERYGDAASGVVLFVDDEDVAVIAAGELEDALVGGYECIDFTKGEGGAYIHAWADAFAGVGDIELGLEGVGRGVDGGVDDLDGGREDLVGVDVAEDVDLHALLDEREIAFGDIDDGFEAADLAELQDGSACVHLAVLVVLGADDAAELCLDEGVLLLEAFCLDELVVSGLGLVVDLFADAAAGFESGDAVELGLGAGEVDARGVELGLIHADEHGAFAHTATYLYVDVLDVACDGGRDVHGLVALEG